MRHSPRTRLFAASVAMLATFAFAACGDDDDDTSATTDAEATADTAVDVTTGATATDASSETSGDVEGTTPEDGSAGEVGEREEYVEAASEGFPTDDEEFAGCIGEAIISDDVYAAIEEAGVTVQDFGDTGPAGQGIVLTEEQAAPVAESVAACGELIDIFPAGTERTCAEEHMSNDQLAGYVTSLLFNVTPSDELQGAYDDMQACITESAPTTTS